MTVLLERSDFTIREGAEADFSAAMVERGLPILRAVPGASLVQFGRGVERPSAFMLLVAWESMDAHKTYNTTQACQDIRALIGGFATGGAMEHFEMEG
ncbi:MAG TPA: antibiotic biosynthesis monooxygenase [Sphingobium sp.]|uniref:putative quinol monooxygenase n=1 Tax=Sphingobium sp. TaxID=1912891 RepID=UPI002ED6654F